MKLKFTKMHGLGNDFIVVNGVNGVAGRKGTLPNFKKTGKILGDRRFGVGCDQILVLKNSKKADFKMEIYNSDGSQVEMCGNGIRCLGHYVRTHKLSRKSELSVETLAGIQIIKFLPKGLIQVDMGAPVLEGLKIPTTIHGNIVNHDVSFDGHPFQITCVSMGNPHCVIYVKNVDEYPVHEIGRMIETSSIFPKRTNVEFVELISSKEVKMRVWERGAGETLACGSGACAVGVAGVLNEVHDRKVKVNLPGGPLVIEWNQKTNHVLMTGPAEEVFEGVIQV
ncbi:MAG: diaminopimelate epimerase [Deltaproteobacteria bacterium]|nr:MAG: diaminopimelate epimerase [Deltaproteobacteria bacterium]